jgi:hypothetical protein
MESLLFSTHRQEKIFSKEWYKGMKTVELQNIDDILKKNQVTLLCKILFFIHSRFFETTDISNRKSFIRRTIQNSFRVWDNTTRWFSFCFQRKSFNNLPTSVKVQFRQ